MKKPLRIVLCILLVCLLLVGIWCAVSYYMQKNLPTYSGELPRSVMIDGQIYRQVYPQNYPSDKRLSALAEESEPDGYILRKSTDTDHLPAENDTSNFSACVGQPYVFVEGKCLVYMDGKWHLFELFPPPEQLGNS